MLKKLKGFLNRAAYKWLVSRMQEQMYFKLLKNSDKDKIFTPGWTHMSNLQLIDRLEQELIELKEAIKINDNLHIKEEAIDVANIAAMIADNNGL